MVYQRSREAIEGEPKPLSIGWAFAIAVACCALGVRATEASGDTLGFSRVVCSAIVLAAFFYLRRFSLVKGLVLALSLEIVFGGALFVFVDYPFVRTHAPELGRVTVMTLQRFEHRSAHAPATLAKV